MANLTTDEAMKIAVVLEETWAYEYKERKKLNGGGSEPTGLRAGFEEDFSFGEEDDNDYWDRPDILYGTPIE